MTGEAESDRTMRHEPRKQVGLRFPALLDELIDAQVQAVHEAGGRTDRSELIGSLVFLASQLRLTGEDLHTGIIEYRLAKYYQLKPPEQ